MKSGIPWSLKRVDEDTRQAVIDAARRSGMTVSDWLSQALAGRQAEEPQRRRPPGEALAKSLGQIKQELDAIERRLRDPQRFGKSVPDMVAELAREIEGSDERARTQVEGARDRRALPARPAGKVADAVRDLEQRIAEMGVRAVTQAAPDPAHLDDIRHHLDALLARTPGTVAAAPQPIPQPMPSPDPMARLEEQIAEISGRLRTEHAERHEQQPIRRMQLASAVDEIAAHQRTIDDRAEAFTPPGRESGLAAEVAALRSEIAALAEQVSNAGRTGAEDQAALYELARRIDMLSADRPADRELMTGIRESLETVQAMVEVAASDAALGRLARRQEELASQVNALLAGAPNRRQVEVLAEDVAALRHAFETDGMPGAVDRIEARIGDLGHAIDAMLAVQQAAAEPGPLLEQLEERLGEISRRVEDVRRASGQQMADIGQRLEERVEDGFGHVAGVLAAVPRQAAALEAMQDRLQDVVERMDGLEAARGEPEVALEAIRAEVHALRADLMERPFDRSETEHLEIQIRELAHQLETVAALTPRTHDISQLEDQVSRLAGEIEDAKPRVAALDGVAMTLARLEEGLAEATRQSIMGARAEAQQAVTQLSELVAQYEIDSDLVRELMRDLETVKTVAGTGEDGSRARIEAVSRTLGEVIDRLSRLEQGRSSGGQASSATATLVGSATPERTTPEGRSADRRADFVAAARRAAQSAAARVAVDQYSPARQQPAAPAVEPPPAPEAVRESRPGAFARLSQAIRMRRKPLLLAAAVIVLAIGAMQIYGRLSAGKDETALISHSAEATPRPVDEAQAIADAPIAEATPVAPDIAQIALVPPAASPDPAIAFAEPAGVIDRFELTSPAPDTAAFEPRVVTPAAAAMEATPGSAGVDPLIGPPALVQAADDGDPNAAFELARRYAEGSAVPKDLARAAQWYRRAAEGGIAVAQYRLASLYERGQGVEQNLVAAVNWYQRAADQGNVNAMHNLAVLMSEGVEGPPDHDKALQWFLAAGNYGVRDSQYNLGVIFARGLGPEQDLAESYKWFAIAAVQGDADALARRDEVASAMTPAELEQARAAVQAWEAKPTIADANKVASPPAAWQDGGQAIAEVDRQALVRKIQVLLAEQGFDPGPPDGVAGPKTVDAVRAYQRRNGQPETGALDEVLVASLGAGPL
jgi:localization factor PodJL